MNNKLIIKLIRFCHFILIFYITLGPLFFRNQISNIITILLFILYRWMTNDHSCMLTKIENKISGSKGGFIYRFVNPIYSLNESFFQKQLYFVTFSWVMILILYNLTYLETRNY